MIQLTQTHGLHVPAALLGGHLGKRSSAQLRRVSVQLDLRCPSKIQPVRAENTTSIFPKYHLENASVYLLNIITKSTARGGDGTEYTH